MDEVYFAIDLIPDALEKRTLRTSIILRRVAHEWGWLVDDNKTRTLRDYFNGGESIDEIISEIQGTQRGHGGHY